MAKTFPKTLYVKIEADDENPYFVADADASVLVEMFQKIKVAKYQLVEISQAEGVAQFSKAKRQR